MREALGSWLSGPATVADKSSALMYRGENLGLPAKGPGSVASNARRTLSLCIDWFACLGLCLLLWNKTALLGTETLCIWWLACILSVWWMSRTPGQLLCGIYVTTLNLKPIATEDDIPDPECNLPRSRGVGLVKAAIRQTLLLPLLIPAFSQDENGRGLHDRATATIVLSS